MPAGPAGINATATAVKMSGIVPVAVTASVLGQEDELRRVVRVEQLQLRRRVGADGADLNVVDVVGLALRESADNVAEYCTRQGDVRELAGELLEVQLGVTDTSACGLLDGDDGQERIAARPRHDDRDRVGARGGRLDPTTDIDPRVPVAAGLSCVAASRDQRVDVAGDVRHARRRNRREVGSANADDVRIAGGLRTREETRPSRVRRDTRRGTVVGRLDGHGSLTPTRVVRSRPRWPPTPRAQ